MPVTGTDVARALGLSQSTVSRALRGDARVTQQTRDRVMALAREMGYVPDVMARSLITGRTDTVAVHVADLVNPAVAELISIVHDELHTIGYRAALFSDRYMSSGPELDHLRGGTNDGVIFASGVASTPLVEELVGRGVPLVLLNRDVNNVEVDRVLSDNYLGGRLAAEHLISLGHRRIGLLHNGYETLSIRDRQAGFVDTLDLAGITITPNLKCEVPYSHEGVRDVAATMLAKKNRPTGIFCTADIGALGLLDAALEAGISVPDGLSVVGFDNLAITSWSTISLTTINNPFRAMAKLACSFLQDRMTQTNLVPPRRTVMPVDLVRRRSSGPVFIPAGRR